MTFRSVSARVVLCALTLASPGTMLTASSGEIVITVTVRQVSTANIVLDVDSSALSWSAVADAIGYDIVRGDLQTLLNGAGDFTAATEECLANDHPTTSLAYSAVPDPGGKFWIVVRDVRIAGRGTYDSGGSSQVGSRDLEIDASNLSCP